MVFVHSFVRLLLSVTPRVVDEALELRCARVQLSARSAFGRIRKKSAGNPLPCDVLPVRYLTGGEMGDGVEFGDHRVNTVVFPTHKLTNRHGFHHVDSGGNVGPLVEQFVVEPHTSLGSRRFGDLLTEGEGLKAFGGSDGRIIRHSPLRRTAPVTFTGHVSVPRIQPGIAPEFVGASRAWIKDGLRERVIAHERNPIMERVGCVRVATASGANRWRRVPVNRFNLLRNDPFPPAVLARRGIRFWGGDYRGTVVAKVRLVAVLTIVVINGGEVDRVCVFNAVRRQSLQSAVASLAEGVLNLALTLKNNGDALNVDLATAPEVVKIGD